MPAPDWEAILRDLDRYSCRCGSGGAIACDEDCPGDQRDPTVIAALKALIATVRAWH